MCIQTHPIGKWWIFLARIYSYHTYHLWHMLITFGRGIVNSCHRPLEASLFVALHKAMDLTPPVSTIPVLVPKLRTHTKSLKPSVLASPHIYIMDISWFSSLISPSVATSYRDKRSSASRRLLDNLAGAFLVSRTEPGWPGRGETLVTLDIHGYPAILMSKNLWWVDSVTPIVGTWNNLHVRQYPQYPFSGHVLLAENLHFQDITLLKSPKRIHASDSHQCTNSRQTSPPTWIHQMGYSQLYLDYSRWMIVQFLVVSLDAHPRTQTVGILMHIGMLMIIDASCCDLDDTQSSEAKHLAAAKIHCEPSGARSSTLHRFLRCRHFMAADAVIMKTMNKTW